MKFTAQGWQLAISAILLNFAAATKGATLTTLLSFDGTNGMSPSGALVADAQGNLYGTAAGDFGANAGSIYQFNPHTRVLSTLFTFNHDDGAYPTSGVIIDSDGNLYGTTYQGGSANAGTVFQLAAGTHTLTTLATFDGTNGAAPDAGLIKDSQGNFFGVTGSGGTNGTGTIFEIPAGTSTLLTLASFKPGQGKYPDVGIAMDAAGNLYGTTPWGGTGGRGTVFELIADTHQLVTLVDFKADLTTGANPYTQPLVAPDGSLYGATGGGGISATSVTYGTIFKMDPITHTLTTLISLDGFHGADPVEGFIADANGKLYGLTGHEGGANEGTVFVFDPATLGMTTLATFRGPNGDNPLSTLYPDSDGNLYGTTQQGGTDNLGIIFEVSDTGFAIPEPSTLASLLLGTLACLYRK